MKSSIKSVMEIVDELDNCANGSPCIAQQIRLAYNYGLIEGMLREKPKLPKKGAVSTLRKTFNKRRSAVGKKPKKSTRLLSKYGT